MKQPKSSFIEDLNGEGVLAEFLDKYLYEKLNIQEFSRNTRDQPHFMNNQYKGIDATFKFNGSDFIVDEKATLHYPNGIPTFAFELRYRKNNQWRPGWFYDESKETEYYLLAWPKRNVMKLSDLKLNDISTVEVMLISRKDLQDYLFKNYAINKDAIQAAVDEIIKAKKYGKLHPIHESSKHYYYYTENLQETPVNLVIHKDTLKEMALFHYVIYRNKPYAQDENSNIWLKKQFQNKKK